MNTVLYLQFTAVSLLSLLIGAAAAWLGIRAVATSRRRDAQTEAARIIEQANIDAENHRREVEIKLKELAVAQKEKIESEARAFRRENHEKERALNKRQDMIDKQVDDLRKQEKLVEVTQRRLADKIEENKARGAEIQKTLEKQRQSLYEISGLSQDAATKQLLKNLETELSDEEGAIILRHEKRVTEQCQETARNILLLALQRYAAAHTAEATTSTVDIPNDDMKGRIIGREGRNIRAFEKVTGVDVIIDDTPGVVIVSAFDAIRREVARLTLNRLITDGRIHPARIEEIYNETNEEIQAFIQRAGLEAAEEVDVHGLHDRVLNLLGRLYFRTSYSQNVLRHSIEVAFLSGLIAVELGLDERLARRCGLLHDIGKAADHELEGGHPKIGADILKRYGEPFEVIQAALGHHDDIKIANPYTVIVAAADACSASRPGARRETLENYVKRMEELENIAMEFPSVEQAFAVQAGREMRVLVNAGQSTDESATKTCRDIVKTLKERLQFPGEMKVTVIREVRATEVAK
ncbi:MAG: ribonuclease Y [Planctomycetia bacterium]|nr:ribonuclease Y [Planctomycetia bacterium]